MNTPNNKRKKDSQEKIEKVFIQLIQKKNISEISVSTICEKAGLNRSTFYANYIDIYDLVEKVKDRMADDFAEFQIAQNSKQDSNGYLNLFKHIKDNQIFFKTYFKLEEISLTPATSYNIDLATKFYNNQYIDYHIEFFRAGLNAIIKKWLNSGCRETPEEMSNILTNEYKNKN
ncbi:MAG: TetR/AcrR family transcriptional regulator [Clostridia bacterium]|nr:TetR/AcrR family transcriptional regulator [Clostridia bacterium]